MRNRFFVILLLLLSHAYSALIYQQEYSFKQGQIKIIRRGIVIERPKIALVLSGGGARGAAHIGVIKALKKYQIPIDLIVGTSIGSIVGGLYASGYSTDEILKIMQSIAWDEIYQDRTQRTSLFLGQKGEQDRYLINLRFKKGVPFIPVAISPGQRILMTLSDIILKARYQATASFDLLRVPFRAVTTDLVSGKIVVLKNGNLAEAIDASSSIPLLFVPIERDSMLLVDGGLRSNLPVHVARSEGADIVIAVDVTSPLRKKDEINAPWKIVDQATTIMSELERQIERQYADVLITPDVGLQKNDDYSQLEKLVQLGVDATVEHIPEIKKLIRQNEKIESTPKAFFVKRFSLNQSKMGIQDYLTLRSMEGKWQNLNKLISTFEKLEGLGRYQKITVLGDTSRDSIELTIQFDPFPPVNNIVIKGMQQENEQNFRKVMLQQEGLPLNIFNLQNDLEYLTDIYRRDGFSLMQVDSLVWKAENRNLMICVDEGTIKDIEIQGNTKIKSYVIAREFNRQKGKIFNWRKIAQAIRNVYATQLFERVTVDILKVSAGYRLVVRVKEKSTVVLRVGGKYDTDRRAQVYTEFGDESLLGFGIKAMLVGRFGNKDGKLGFKLRDDRIFTTYLTFDLQGYYSWQVNPITNPNGAKGLYREERRGVRFQAGQQLKRLGQLVFELRQENVKDATEKGYFGYPQNIELRTFAIRAVADKRDRIDFPNKGINNYWAWESGNRLVLGSKEPYTKILVNLEGYYSFRNQATWHLRSFFGIGDRSLPFSENFRLGGLNEFYGLYKNEYFGRQLLLLNAEYRFRLPLKRYLNQNLMLRNFYLSMRYDFAGIWPEPNLVFSSKDFFSGYGISFDIDTIVGPLRFSIGHLSGGRTVGYISFGFNY